MRRLDSALDAVQHLEAKLAACDQLNNVLEAEKIQWSHEKINQQVVIQQALNQSNATNNSYLEENDRLKEEIRSLKEELASK
jgi:hypothetical protein